MNIVFDLFGVVFAWTPEAMIDAGDIDKAYHAQVKAGLFEYVDWLALDRGTLSHEQALRRSANHTGFSLETTAELMALIPKALVPMPRTVDLMRRLRAKGHILYYLSNINDNCIASLERNCPFWDVFSGGIASCRVHALKPEPEIYTALLDTYPLDVSETLFMDDRLENLQAAATFGLQTLHFQSPEQATAACREKGVIS